jgi:hypothetical protein
LFKKPWTLSKKVEIMFGVGPEWTHIRENGVSTNSVAGEIALDFMFWPSPKRKFGWYIEPAYDYTFGGGHDQAIGVSIGLLISIRRHPLETTGFVMRDGRPIPGPSAPLLSDGSGRSRGCSGGAVNLRDH